MFSRKHLLFLEKTKKGEKSNKTLPTHAEKKPKIEVPMLRIRIP